MQTIEQHLTPFISRLFPVPKADVSMFDQGSYLQSAYQGFNGGYFWNRALLIRPAYQVAGAPLTISDWNDPVLWKNKFDDICNNVTFFAEDAFGMQFGINGERIVQFDPETATFADIGEHIHDWCRELVRDSDFYTGAPVLAAWERKNHPIGVGYRLIPKQLFMLGGEFHSDNMICKLDLDGMIARAQFWKMTKDLPDGEKIVFRIEP